jgi:hypothetical protein
MHHTNKDTNKDAHKDTNKDTIEDTNTMPNSQFHVARAHFIRCALPPFVSKGDLVSFAASKAFASGLVSSHVATLGVYEDGDDTAAHLNAFKKKSGLCIQDASLEIEVLLLPIVVIVCIAAVAAAMFQS